jgi:hypothetical protein
MQPVSESDTAIKRSGLRIGVLCVSRLQLANLCIIESQQRNNDILCCRALQGSSEGEPQAKYRQSVVS